MPAGKDHGIADHQVLFHGVHGCINNSNARQNFSTRLIRSAGAEDVPGRNQHPVHHADKKRTGHVFPGTQPNHSDPSFPDMILSLNNPLIGC